jgi:hypothetical protein
MYGSLSNNFWLSEGLYYKEIYGRKYFCEVVSYYATRPKSYIYEQGWSLPEWSHNEILH